MRTLKTPFYTRHLSALTWTRSADDRIILENQYGEQWEAVRSVPLSERQIQMIKLGWFDGFSEAESKEFIQICDQCGKQFDSLREGKMRMAEVFCSLECADKAYPNFNK